MNYSRLEKLPLGSIQAEGWLLRQLEFQKHGLTGHLEEQWADLGPDNGWKGGNGESWERGPYYLDGLVPLAYILKDNELTAKAQKWIEWTLSSQKPDGNFGPEAITTVNTEIDKNQDWWHYMIMLKVLMQYYEATMDQRVVGFIERFLFYISENITDMPLRGWAKARGSELLLCINWIQSYVDDPDYSNLTDLLISQTIDWSDIFDDFPFWRKVERWDWRTHAVNVAMGIKMPGILYEVKGDKRYLDIVDKGIKSLMTYHGQVHGMFSGDEWLSGTSPSQGIELCAIVEYMYSLEELLRISGRAHYGDILDKVAFNALPASVSPDWMSHQYDQQVNQVICNTARRKWSNGPDANLFGLEPHFGCCTANMHQGWPKFTGSIVMSNKTGGLVFVTYAPSVIHSKTKNGADLIMEISGDYPFREKVKIKLSLSKPAQFPIFFRIPSWCKKFHLLVNNDKAVYEASDGFASVKRQWKDNDMIELTLKMEPAITRRSMYAASVEHGPLQYALPIEEDWRVLVKREMFNDYEVYPKSQWQYGLISDTDVTVDYCSMPEQPFSTNPPVKLKVQGKFLPGWGMKDNSADEPQLYYNDPGQPVQEITLFPYGCSKLRIGELPLLKSP